MGDHHPAAEQNLELFGEGRRSVGTGRHGARGVMATVVLTVTRLGCGRVLLTGGAFTGLPESADDFWHLKSEKIIQK